MIELCMRPFVNEGKATYNQSTLPTVRATFVLVCNIEPTQCEKYYLRV